MAFGCAVTTMVRLTDTGEHAPDGVMVLIIVWVPAGVADKSIWPVLVLTNTAPVGDENTPATPPPLKVGDGSADEVQNGLPL